MNLFSTSVVVADYFSERYIPDFISFLKGEDTMDLELLYTMLTRPSTFVGLLVLLPDTHRLRLVPTFGDFAQLFKDPGYALSFLAHMHPASASLLFPGERIPEKANVRPPPHGVCRFASEWLHRPRIALVLCQLLEKQETFLGDVGAFLGCFYKPEDGLMFLSALGTKDTNVLFPGCATTGVNKSPYPRDFTKFSVMLKEGLDQAFVLINLIDDKEKGKLLFGNQFGKLNEMTEKQKASACLPVSQEVIRDYCNKKGGRVILVTMANEAKGWIKLPMCSQCKQHSLAVTECGKCKNYGWCPACEPGGPHHCAELRKRRIRYKKKYKRIRQCNHCGDSCLGGMKMCKGCRKAHFCNKKCQKAGWKAHRAECRST
jgi:hypothetical protein